MRIGPTNKVIMVKPRHWWFEVEGTAPNANIYVHTDKGRLRVRGDNTAAVYGAVDVVRLLTEEEKRHESNKRYSQPVKVRMNKFTFSIKKLGLHLPVHSYTICPGPFVAICM